jgi:serine/threonine-protein kinase RsbT
LKAATSPATSATPGAAATAARRPRVEVVVTHEHDVAGVIAVASRFCADQGLPRLFGAHVATAASELANNLWMHAARGGQVSVALIESMDRRGVELTAVDEGPGIADLAQALTEGYSSAGGLGLGLPGVRRLMDEFEVHTGAGRGTRVVARKWMPRCS